jgi:hypothetical protein
MKKKVNTFELNLEYRFNSETLMPKLRSSVDQALESWSARSATNKDDKNSRRTKPI